MRLATLRMLTAAAFLAALHGAGPLAAQDAEWSYSGDTDPQMWGRLSKAYAPCGEGTQQSPIDLSGAVTAELGGVEMLWEPVQWTVRNTGKTIRLEAPGAGSVVVEDQSYTFEAIHLHTPSEHKIDGRRFAMEVHFVFAKPDGDMAVVAVMLEPGGENDLFASIMEKAPAKEGEAALGRADPRTLIPGESGVLRYRGSLTTPPCSETVVWSVMETPVKVRDDDIQAFRTIFPENARPLQPLNRRYILEE